MPYGSYGEVRVYESPSGLTTLGPRKACDAFSGGPGDTRGAFRGLNVDLGHDTVFDGKKHLANCLNDIKNEIYYSSGMHFDTFSTRSRCIYVICYALTMQIIFQYFHSF